MAVHSICLRLILDVFQGLDIPGWQAEMLRSPNVQADVILIRSKIPFPLANRKICLCSDYLTLLIVYLDRPTCIRTYEDSLASIQTLQITFV